MKTDCTEYTFDGCGGYWKCHNCRETHIRLKSFDGKSTTHCPHCGKELNFIPIKIEKEGKQMKTSVMIKELEFARQKEKNKKYPTFATNYYDLLTDVINKISELEEINQAFTEVIDEELVLLVVMSLPKEQAVAFILIWYRRKQKEEDVKC